MFMYQRPTTAKKHFDVIPKTPMNTYHVNKLESDDLNPDNPAWHIHKAETHHINLKLIRPILNIISVCKSEDSNVILV